MSDSNWMLEKQKHLNQKQKEKEKEAGIEDAEQSLERDFAENTTLHGLNRIANPHKSTWLRVVWFLAVGACAGVCFWQISLRLTAYLRHDATTKIDVKYRSRLTFPAVTICNFNRFRYSEITVADLQFLQYVLLAEDYDYDSYESFSLSWYGESFDYYTLFGNQSGSFNYTEFTLRAGFVLDDLTLLECEWRGRQCYAKNFTHVFTSYGSCYQFNSGGDDGSEPLLKEDQPGVGNGLHLLLDIQQDEYTETYSGNLEAGIKILVHDQIDPPLMDSLGSAIPPGYHAFVGVKRNEYLNLGQPWGDCDRSASLQYYTNYTLSGCFIECRLANIINECGCRPVRYPGTAEVCTPYESANCVSETLRRFKNGEFGTCDCPISCEYVGYDTSISYGSIPSRSVADDLMTRYGLNESYVRENIISLDVYYEELNFQIIEQQIAIPADSLISDVGGQIGLFLGGSILTLGELIEYIVSRFKRLCTSKQKRQTGGMTTNGNGNVNKENDSMSLGPRLFISRDSPQYR